MCWHARSSKADSSTGELRQAHLLLSWHVVEPTIRRVLEKAGGEGGERGRGGGGGSVPMILCENPHVVCPIVEVPEGVVKANPVQCGQHSCLVQVHPLACTVVTARSSHWNCSKKKDDQLENKSCVSFFKSIIKSQHHYNIHSSRIAKIIRSSRPCKPRHVWNSIPCALPCFGYEECNECDE